jgi:hypothetical protein
MESRRPCVIFKPALSLDGVDEWLRVLLGRNLMKGYGFGKDPALAMTAASTLHGTPPRQGL